jgi:diguanylate cyclase (GGDEF)-like protein
MNQLTIRQRLLLIMLLPSAVISIALVTFFTISSLRSLEKDQVDHGYAMARYLAPVSEYGLISGQIESLHVLAQSAVQDPGVKATIIVNQKGRVIAVSGRVSLAAERLRSLPQQPSLIFETDDWLAFGAPVIRSVNEADSLYEPAVEAPKAPQEIIGAVFIEFDKTEFLNTQRSLIARGLAIAISGLLVLAAIAISIADSTARPVRRLVLAVHSMTAGKFDTRVTASSPGELGFLEQGFNEMAAQIQSVHQSMQSRIEEATAQLVFQANHDPLTGLINRREFEQRLERALTNAHAGGETFSLLFIDLDRFKPVNDTCGHLAGDELLRQIARLFQGRLRDQDTLARVGGDEFCILLDNCSGAQARQVADDICALTAAYRFIWQDKVFAIGASIGLSQVNRAVRSIKEILAAGDAACYRAKENGRNQVAEQAPDTLTDRRQENSAWGERIAQALRDERILVDAIPLRALQTSATKHSLVEISAHLAESGRSNVSWATLLDAAERCDLAPAIDRYLLEQAISALHNAEIGGKTLHCLVPLSLRSLSRRETLAYLEEKLQPLNNRKNLTLLLSEEETTRDATLAIEFCSAVRQLGCSVALDDFGGGLSSFSHLRALAPSFVKLSRSLTHDLSGNRASTALLRAIQEITQDLDIITIAAGVESSTTLKELGNIGIDYVQGPAIAPSEPFNAWLEGAVMRR